MDKKEALVRELSALGQYYRNDWSDFDGRRLKSQLSHITSWFTADNDEDLTAYSEMLAEQEQEFK